MAKSIGKTTLKLYDWLKDAQNTTHLHSVDVKDHGSLLRYVSIPSELVKTII